MNNKQQLISKVSGFSLIELMIALAIGMFVVLGAIQVFLANQASLRLTDGLAKVQENGRFALELMSRDIRMAGYPADSFGGTRIRGIGGGQLDSVSIEYMVDSATTDCAGNAVGAGAISKNTYSISSGNLICTGNVAGVSEVIVQGVEKMQIVYGEDTDAIPDNLPNRYVMATELANNTGADAAEIAAKTAARWNNVSTVRLNLLVNSINPTLDTPQTYFYGGTSTTATDRLFRAEYMTTITLRNRIL